MSLFLSTNEMLKNKMSRKETKREIKEDAVLRKRPDWDMTWLSDPITVANWVNLLIQSALADWIKVMKVVVNIQARTKIESTDYFKK